MGVKSVHVIIKPVFALTTLKIFVAFTKYSLKLLVSLIHDVNLDCREGNIIEKQWCFLLSETPERGQCDYRLFRSFVILNISLYRIKRKCRIVVQTSAVDKNCIYAFQTKTKTFLRQRYAHVHQHNVQAGVKKEVSKKTNTDVWAWKHLILPFVIPSLARPIIVVIFILRISCP